MGFDRAVVRLVAQAADPRVARRIRLRLPGGLSAGSVLARVMSRVAAERRLGLGVRIESAPVDLRRLLELCGLGALFSR